MKQLTALLAFYLLPFNAAASVDIDRLWIKGDYGYVLVTYTNDTQKTFQKYATITCVASDRSKKKIGVNKRSFFAHQHGPIAPGFSGTVEIPIELNGIKMHSANCSVNER